MTCPSSWAKRCWQLRALLLLAYFEQAMRMDSRKTLQNPTQLLGECRDVDMQ